MTLRHVEPSPTLAINEHCARLDAEGRTVHRFGFGESPFSPPARVRAALQEAAPRVDYAPVRGMAELRALVRDFHATVDGIDLDDRRILVGSGSKILLLNTLLAFERACVVLPQPSWVSYAPQVALAGHELRLLPTTFEQRWRVDPDALDATLAAVPADVEKVLVLDHPGNPDGLAYTAAELEALGSVLGRHGAWALSDEIYGLVHHTGAHVSMARAYPERTLVTGGLSKWCGAGGWRLGIQFAAPEVPLEMIETLSAIAAATYSCAPTPVQHAACAAYRLDDETTTHLGRQREVLAAVAGQVGAAIGGTDIRVHPGEGGFYLFLDFSSMRGRLAGRGITTDLELCTALLEEAGVALLPGSAFLMDPAALTARLAYVDFDGDAVLSDLTAGASAGDAAAGDVATVVARHTTHLSTGTTALVDWSGT